MNLINKIPTEFYKLFASKYRIYYQKFLTAIYEETSRSYSLLGLTEEECKAVMNENIADMALEWSEEQVDEEGEFLTRANMASICLRNLEEWGWLRRDYDETLNYSAKKEVRREKVSLRYTVICTLTVLMRRKIMRF